MRAPLLVLGGAVITLAGSGSAEHCTSWWSAPTFLDTDPLGAGVGPRYYTNDVLGDLECPWGFGECAYLVVFQESNGIHGLQRGDEFLDTTCHAMVEADTVVLI